MTLLDRAEVDARIAELERTIPPARQAPEGFYVELERAVAVLANHAEDRAYAFRQGLAAIRRHAAD